MQKFWDGLPWFVRWPAGLCGFMLGQFASKLPDWAEPFAIVLGFGLALWVVAAALWHWTNERRTQSGKPSLKLDSSHIIVLCLAIALGAAIWQLRPIIGTPGLVAWQGFELQQYTLDRLGKPLAGVETNSGNYQAGYEHAGVVWLNERLTFYITSHQDQKWTAHREPNTHDNPQYQNDNYLKTIFPNAPPGKFPPWGGLARLWQEKPEKWATLLGYREWHCRAKEIKYQEFENGRVIGPIFNIPSIRRGVAIYLFNDGTWDQRYLDKTSAPECESLDSSAAGAEPLFSSGNPLVESPSVEIGFDNRGENGVLQFNAKFLTRGEKLDIFLDYATVGNMPPGESTLLQPTPMQRRVLIQTIDRFAPKQELHVKLGKTERVEGEQIVLQIGGDTSQRMGLTWGHFVGSVVLMKNDGATETYKFLIVSRATDSHRPPPFVIGPKFLGSLNTW